MATLLKLKTTTTVLVASVMLLPGGSSLHAQYVQPAPQHDHINVAQRFHQSGFQTGGQFNDGGRAYPGGMHLTGQSFAPRSYNGGAINGGAMQPFSPATTGNSFQSNSGSTFGAAGYGAAGNSGYGMQPLHGYSSGPGSGGIPQTQGLQSFSGQSYGSASQFSPMQSGMQNAQPWEMHRHWSDFHVPQSAGQLYQMNNSNEIRSQPTFGRR